MTIPVAPNHLTDDDAFDALTHAIGISDAYDEYTAGAPLELLAARADRVREYTATLGGPVASYAHGYASAIDAYLATQGAITAAQTEIAYEDHDTQQQENQVTVTAGRPRCDHGHYMPADTDTCPCGAPQRPRLTLVSLTKATGPHVPRPVTYIKPALPTRARPAADRDGRLAFAAHAATAASITARVTGWSLRPDGTIYQYLPDGTLLSHPGTYRAPLTALFLCRRGAVHAALATSPQGLHNAHTAADCCTNPHLAASRAYTVVPLHNSGNR